MQDLGSRSRDIFILILIHFRIEKCMFNIPEISNFLYVKSLDKNEILLEIHDQSRADIYFPNRFHSPLIEAEPISSSVIHQGSDIASSHNPALSLTQPKSPEGGNMRTKWRERMSVIRVIEKRSKVLSPCGFCSPL